MCQNRNLWRKIGTVSAKKMPCVPEFKYITCDIKLYKICTVSVKKMPGVPEKMPCGPDYNKRCPDVPC